MSIYSITDRQTNFMVNAKQSLGKYNLEQIDLYYDLIVEEYRELESAHTLNLEDEEKLKEAADIIIVAMSYIESYGVAAEDVVSIVQANNLLKVNGTFKKDSNGKVMKSKESINAKEVMMRKLKKLLPLKK